MNKILVILTLDMENLPSNIQEILKHEQEIVAEWKAAGSKRKKELLFVVGDQFKEGEVLEIDQLISDKKKTIKKD